MGKKNAIKQGLAIGGGKLAKSDEAVEDVTIPVDITKIEDEKQYAFGWANIAIASNRE